MALAFADQGYDVVGTDGAELMVETAERERRRRGIANVEFRVMEAAGLALEQESYDAVVCSSVIEYVQDDAVLVRSLVDAIRPGGYMLLSVPHTASVIGRIEDTLRRTMFFARRPGSQHLGFSHRRYNKQALLGLLRSVGLESLQCTSFEVPILGRAGVALSRFNWIGVMLLIVGRKRDERPARRQRRFGGIVSDQGPQPRAVSRKNLWDAAPPLVRRAVGRSLSVLPARVLFGKQFSNYLRFVEQAQWWSADESAAYQLNELRGLCQLAYERTPYYRRAFDEVGFDPRDLTSTDDLLRLPMIDRTELRNHLDEMCTVASDARGVDFVSTGGTEGAPLHFYIGSDRSAIEYAYLVSSWRRVGYDLDVPTAVFRGRVVPEDRRGFRHEYDPILRHHYYSSFHMTDDNMRRYLEHVGRVGPCFLHVYPSTVAILARFIQRERVEPLKNVRGVIAESETVYPQQRRMVEEVFSCRYFSCFGHSEKLVAAAECEHSSDYHVWPTYGYFELIDEQGGRVTESGEWGEIVGTGFINKVVPFIRYRTGDYATYIGDRCRACGREHVILRNIQGHRTQEVLVAADGSLISWTALNMHDATFMRVQRFQFYQDSPGRAVLRIVPANDLGNDDHRRILKNLGRKLDGRIELTIELVDTLSVSPRGKAIYVDQRIETGDRGLG